MKRRVDYMIPILASVAIVAIVAVMAAGCRLQQGEKPQVVVSIAPQRYLLEKIAGNKVDVLCLLEEQSNPENYEPKTSDMMKLERAQAYFTIGNIGYESAIVGKVRNNNPQLCILDTSAGIKLLRGQDADDGEYDPHVWTSVKNAKVIAHNMLLGLVKLYPKHKRYFVKNYDALSTSLDTLDRHIALQLAPVKGCTFIDWHPSLSYFARDYGLHQLALDNGKEPSARDLARRIDLARKSGARVIFVQRQFDSRAASAVNKQIGCSAVEINPMSGDWAGEMSRIASALAATAR